MPSNVKRALESGDAAISGSCVTGLVLWTSDLVLPESVFHFIYFLAILLFFFVTTLYTYLYSLFYSECAKLSEKVDLVKYK